MTARRGQQGFTLVELVVAMAILSIVLAMAFGFFASATEHSADLQERNHLQGEVRLAVDQLVRELRQATFGADDPPLESIGPDALTVLTPDSSTPYHLRRVTWRASGGRLERSAAVSTDTDGAPWQFPPAGPFVAKLGSLRSAGVFEYLDAGGAPTADPAAVRSVVVSVAVDPNPSRPPGPQRYRTTVSLRAAR